MAISEVLAKEFTYEIDDGTEIGTFVEIGGLNSVSPSSSKNDADVTTYADNWVRHLVASRGLELTLGGIYLEDPSTGDRDAGQEQMEVAATKFGSASLVPFQITTPGGAIVSFDASVNATGVGTGGGNEDPAGFSYTVTVSGKPTVT